MIIPGFSSGPSGPVLTVFLTFLFVYALATIYLREQCFRDPTSYFFRPEEARVLGYSAYRREQARKFADEMGAVGRVAQGVNGWVGAGKGVDWSSKADGGRESRRDLVKDIAAPVKWARAEGSPDLCVAISSVSRNGFSYLKETLGSVLEGLSDAERRRIYVVVFLAHVDQTAHEDYGKEWLRNMADALPTYTDIEGMGPPLKPNFVSPSHVKPGSGDSGGGSMSNGYQDLWERRTSDEMLEKRQHSFMEDISRLEREKGYDAHARKQKIDYTVLLDSCAKVQPKYTMTIEDDVIAMDGWFHRLWQALGSARRQAKIMGQESFLYLRIFYDGRLMGWNSEEWPTYLTTCLSIALFELTFLLSTTFILSRGVLQRLPLTKTIRKIMTPTTILLIVGVYTPMAMVLYFLAGRECMLPRQTGVQLMNKYGCCAQGLVFPQEQIDQYLLPMYNASGHADDGGRSGAVDSFLEHWADGQDPYGIELGENWVGGMKGEKVLRFAVTPVLIQHVGGKSSHGAGDQIAGGLTDDMPFDYGFELNDPEGLKREHEAWKVGDAGRVWSR